MSASTLRTYCSRAARRGFDAAGEVAEIAVALHLLGADGLHQVHERAVIGNGRGVVGMRPVGSPDKVARVGGDERVKAQATADLLQFLREVVDRLRVVLQDQQAFHAVVEGLFDGVAGMRIRSVLNYAVSGATASTQEALCTSGNIAAAQTVMILIGTNDIQGGTALATYLANAAEIDAAVRRRVAAGSIEPVMLREHDLPLPGR